MFILHIHTTTTAQYKNDFNIDTKIQLYKTDYVKNVWIFLAWGDLWGDREAAGIHKEGDRGVRMGDRVSGGERVSGKGYGREGEWWGEGNKCERKEEWGEE